MSYSGPNPSAKKVIPQVRHLIHRLRTTRRSEGDEEERQHLVVLEPPSPRPLHHLLPLPRLEVGSSDLDDITILYRYFLFAQEILSSLPSPTHLLGAEDIRLLVKRPVAAGRFTDIWEATHEGRRVVLKEYRYYRTFDVNQIATVRCGRLRRVYS